MNVFHISEICDLGIEKEKKRRDFYEACAGHFSEGKVKSLFGRLKEWEDAHIKKFTEIRQSLNEEESAESYPGELTAYMQALVDERLYQQVSPKEFAKNVTAPLEAIAYAIGFEKDAIIFFSELKPFAVGARAGTIDTLINEEKQHIVYLAALRKELS